MSTLPALGKLEVYFPFADGALGYNCTECGYRCCKGAGFGASKRELVQLTARYPFVSLFVNPRREPEQPLVQLTNFAPSCFFLRDLPVDDDLLRRLASSDLMAARWQKEPRVPGDALVAAHREHLVALRTTIADFLDAPTTIARDHARFSTELGIMLPRLRLSLLRTRPLLPSAEESLAALLPQLGRRLTALSVYLELCVAAGAILTLGLVDDAFRQGAMFCEMLSLLDRVPTIQPGKSGESDAYQLTLYRTQEAELHRLLRFIHDENPQRRLTLGAIFRVLCISDTGVRAQVLQSFTREALGHFRFDAV